MANICTEGRFACAMNDRNDLTQGPIIRKLILFFLPIAAGMLFQQLYNAVDALVVGKYVGTAALAAVGGSSAMLVNLIIGFCTSLTAGASVVISQLYGARSRAKVSAAVQTSFLFCAVLGIFVGAAIVLLAAPLLRLLKTPADTFADALTYLRIFFAGSLFMLLYNMGSGVLRAVGNSRFPFLCLVVSCVLNIALDILFVITFRMGVAGAAWATVIAQGVSAALVCVRLLRSRNDDRLILNRNLFDWSLFRSIMSIGIPAGLQSSMYGISNAILQIGINTLGTTVVASWAMTGKIDGAYWAVSTAYGSAITTFVAQCYGAGDQSRVREASRKGLVLFIFITLGSSTLLLSLGRPLLRLFSNDPAVISTTWDIMVYFVPIYILWSFVEHFSGVLRGMGDAVIPSVILGIGICAVRILWVVTVFAARPTLPVVCICYPVSWVVTDIAIMIYYRKKSHLPGKTF